MVHFSKNLAHLRKLKGLSQEAFAEELNITRARVSSYEEKRSEPPLELLLRIADFFRLPADALVRNDLSKAKNTSFITLGNNKVLFPIQVDDQGEDHVEVVPLKSSAGYLLGYSDPEYIEQLQTIRLPFLPTGKYRAFPIKGDSMLPVREGDFIVSKYVENMRDLRHGTTYVVLTKSDGLVYKRADTGKLKKGYLTLISDNREYPPFDVPLEEVLELWEFCLRLDFSGRQPEELSISSIHQMLRSMQIDLEKVKARLA